jgi:hypothetical protein
MVIKQERDLVLHSVLLYQVLIFMLKIHQEFALRFALLELGGYSQQENVFKILFYVEFNGLIIQQICAYQFVQLVMIFMEIQQLNFVFLFVLLVIILMTKLAHVFKNALIIMALMELLAITQLAYANNFVHSQIPLLILKH